MSKYGVFSCPNTGTYGTEKTPHLDTFHAVSTISARLSAELIKVLRQTGSTYTNENFT